MHLDPQKRLLWILRRLLPEAPQREKHRAIRFFIFLATCVFIVVSASGAALGALELPAFVGAMALLFGVSGVLLHHRLTRPRHAWAPQELILGPGFLLQRRAGRPLLAITRDEITRIVQKKNGALVVHTANRFRCITVPADLYGYEEVRRTLLQWHPIEQAALRPRQVSASLRSSWR